MDFVAADVALDRRAGNDLALRRTTLSVCGYG
jgi:hypothetical protein